MIAYNRRKRNEWLKEKQQESAVQLEEARRAAAAGVLTEDQRLMLNRERAAEEAEMARKSKKGIMTRAKEAVFGGLSEEEVQGGKIGAAARAAKEQIQTRTEPQDVSSEASVVQAIQSKIEEHRRTGEALEQVVHPQGGPLDRRAEALAHKTTGWTSWLQRR